MKLYSIDMLIHATAYVRAETPEEATRLARDLLTGSDVALANCNCDVVSGESFDSEELPDVSLSPAATIGFVDGEPAEVQS